MVSSIPLLLDYTGPSTTSRPSSGIHSLVRAVLLCVALAIVSLGFIVSGISSLLTSAGSVPHPGDLFQA